MQSHGEEKRQFMELWPQSLALAIVIVHVFLGVDRALPETPKEIWSDLLREGDP